MIRNKNPPQDPVSRPAKETALRDPGSAPALALTPTRVLDQTHPNAPRGRGGSGLPYGQKGGKRDCPLPVSLICHRLTHPCHNSVMSIFIV